MTDGDMVMNPRHFGRNPQIRIRITDHYRLRLNFGGGLSTVTVFSIATATSLLRVHVLLQLLVTYLAFCGMAISNALAIEAYTREYDRNKVNKLHVYDAGRPHTTTLADF